MPELPEVETIKRQLDKSIVGKKIKNAEILYPRFLNVPEKQFRKAVIGAKVKSVRRRAKLLIINLSNTWSLLIHLKMTGQLIFTAKPQSEKRSRTQNKHKHIIYRFSDNSALTHADIRKFGYVKLLKTAELDNYFIKAGYGIEPLEKEFALSVFKKILRAKPNQKMKQFLMDQKNIAGIGNIYADEILFYAGILPTRVIKTLNENEIKKIFRGIKKILADAIKYRGSSIGDYRDASGRVGKYHLQLKVYGRAGQPCLRCKTPVKKIKLSGRGTHFCPKCQK